MLPYPHGTAAGDIGNNALIDLGNTPGSVGGKFVGFGEDGTSAIVNRSSWALSANIDYVYQSLSRELAMPNIDAWTVGAGAGASYHFTGDDVWCGDAGYPAPGAGNPPPEQEGYDRLLSVLDAEYNQLTDVLGNKVCLKSVRDNADAIDVYRAGFVATPIIRFRTANPITGAIVTDPYTIPDGTVVKLVHARKSSLENLSTDTFTKIPVRVAEEVPAGVVLQDGSRPLTNTWDVGKQEISNIDTLLGRADDDFEVNAGTSRTLNLRGTEVYAYGASRASLQASAASAQADIQAPAGEVFFQDTRLSCYLSRAGDSVEGAFTGLWTAMNSRLGCISSLAGNRFIDISTPIAFDDATGHVTWPNCVMSHNGDRRALATGHVTAPVATSVLVIDSAFTAQQRLVSNVLPTDTVMAIYAYGGAAFTMKYDARWPISRKSSGLEVSVGCDSSGNLLPGCDFLDLDTAFNLISALSLTTVGAHRSYTVRLKGQTTVSGTLTPPNGLVLIGEDNPQIFVNHGASLNTLDGVMSNPWVEIYNVTFQWANAAAAQDADKGALANLGSNSIVHGVQFKAHGSGKSFGNGLIWGAMGNLAITIENCYAEVSTSFVRGSGLGPVPASDILMESIVRRCLVKNLSGGASTGTAIDVAGDGNVVEGCYVVDIGDLFTNGIRIGQRGRAIGNTVYGTGPAGGIGILVQTNSGNTVSLASVIGNFVSDAQYGVGCQIQAASTSPRVITARFQGNRIENTRVGVWVDNDAGKTLAGSDFQIIDNTVNITSGLLSAAIFVKTARHASIRGNKLSNLGGLGIWVSTSTASHVSSNDIDGYSGLVSRGILIDNLAANPSAVTGNHIFSVGGLGGATDAVIAIFADDCIVQGNLIDGATGGATNTPFDVYVEGARCAILGNTIRYFSRISVNIAVGGALNARIEGNDIFGGTSGINGWCVSISASGCQVSGNFIHGSTTGAIYSVSSHTIIRGNHIWNVFSHTAAAATKHTIKLDSTAVASSIENNNLRECGDAADAHITYHILSLGGGSIIGNRIVDCVGYNAAGFFTYFIATQGVHVIQGNYLENDVSSANFPYAAYGINPSTGAEKSIINGNIINWTGAHVGAAGSVIVAIELGTMSKQMVVSNVIGSFTMAAPTLGICYGIESTGTFCSFIGNASETYINLAYDGTGTHLGVSVGNIAIGCTFATNTLGYKPPATATVDLLDDINPAVS